MSTYGTARYGTATYGAAVAEPSPFLEPLGVIQMVDDGLWIQQIEEAGSPRMRNRRRQQTRLIIRGRQKPMLYRIYNADGSTRDLTNDTLTLSMFRLFAGDQGIDLNVPVRARDVRMDDVVIQGATTEKLNQSTNRGELQHDPMNDGQEWEHGHGSLNQAPGLYGVQFHVTDANGDITDYPEGELGLLLVAILPTTRELDE